MLSDNYDNLLKKTIKNENLSNEEKEMIQILNNNKLEPHQRLVRYQQLLFTKLNARASDRVDKIDHPRVASRYRVSDIGHPLAPTHYRPSDIGHQLASSELKRKLDKSAQYEDPNQNYKETSLDRLFSIHRGDVEDIFSSSPRQSSAQDFHDANSTGEEERERHSTPNANFDIYQRDKEEFDISREHQRIIDEVARQSSSIPDLKKLQFRNLGDPNEK